MDDAVVAGNEAEVIVDDAAESSADFEAGFAGTPTEETPPAVVEEKAAPAEEPAPVVPEVKYRQVTQDEWDELQKNTSSQFDKAFGKVGGIERTLKELRDLQSATPQGIQVEVSDDIVAELKEEFPEIGDLALKAFTKFASKLKGTAGAQATVDPQEIAKQVQTTATGLVRALEEEALSDAHENWREIVGTQDSDVPFRKWLATQPAAYSAKLNSTESSAVISRAIDRFKAFELSQKTPENPKPPAPSTRQQRLAAAVTTKGAGGNAPGPSEDDEFEAGFKSR